MATVSIEIPDEKIMSLLCNAFEGGSNYWYSQAEPVFAKGVARKDVGEGGRLQPRNEDGTENYYHWCELLPFIPGCAVKFKVNMEEGKSKMKTVLLDRAAIDRGLQLMASKHPRHFGNFMDENDDADTGDVFLQLCVLGEVIFG